MLHIGHFFRRSGAWTIIGLLFLSFSSTAAFSSDFRINPTTLVLDKNARSGAFSVINNGTEKLNVQISLKAWTQDESGKDVYTDTRDIVFFPKIMTIAPNEQRAIRVGIKGPHSLREKTYRLFVEEIPTQQKTPVTGMKGKIGAGLSIAFRYATPIFVMPVLPQESGVIDQVRMVRGVARAVLKNTGNVHLKLLTVHFSGKAEDGEELFSQDVGGWYVLQGMSHTYDVTVPKDVCSKLTTIEVVAQSENAPLKGTVNVDKKMCTQ